MNEERRAHPRFPSWIPGTARCGPDSSATPVRILDCSLRGAALQGELPGGQGALITLQVDWSGLSLTIPATIVASEAGPEFPVTHLKFEEPTPSQAIEIAALVGAKAAAFREGQRGLLHALAAG